MAPKAAHVSLFPDAGIATGYPQLALHVGDDDGNQSLCFCDDVLLTEPPPKNYIFLNPKNSLGAQLNLLRKLSLQFPAGSFNSLAECSLLARMSYMALNETHQESVTSTPCYPCSVLRLRPVLCVSCEESLNVPYRVEGGLAGTLLSRWSNTPCVQVMDIEISRD